ncbi:hypothetical protein GIB67_001831 [Kingdonia uniflora]|uniref:Uncharacterized protein n=1 Tax=Kingdonia uniflora TaxID=39325 RepID=A0A7J7LC29_9MAGN|nr:hypothetical protein GIB67_001831 [Kingdonia uniflora]
MTRQIASSLDKTAKLLDLTTTAVSEHGAIPDISGVNINSRISGEYPSLMRMLTVQPHLITDKGYLEHAIKYAIDCGVTDQWMLGRTLGFPPKEDTEELLITDPNGIRSITEREHITLSYDPDDLSSITEMEYRTLEPVS